MKTQRAEIVIGNNLPLSEWLVSKTSLRQMMDKKVLLFILIVKKLEKRGLLTEPGTYRLDFKSYTDFTLQRRVQ